MFFPTSQWDSRISSNFMIFLDQKSQPCLQLLRHLCQGRLPVVFEKIQGSCLSLLNLSMLMGLTLIIEDLKRKRRKVMESVSRCKWCRLETLVSIATAVLPPLPFWNLFDHATAFQDLWRLFQLFSYLNGGATRSRGSLCNHCGAMQSSCFPTQCLTGRHCRNETKAKRILVHIVSSCFLSRILSPDAQSSQLVSKRAYPFSINIH